MKYFLLTLAAAHAVSAWDWSGVVGSGIAPATDDSALGLFWNAASFPNASASTSIRMGNQDFTISIAVTEVAPEGLNTDIEDPRLVNTAYVPRRYGDEISTRLRTKVRTK